MTKKRESKSKEGKDCHCVSHTEIEGEKNCEKFFFMNQANVELMIAMSMIKKIMTTALNPLGEERAGDNEKRTTKIKREKKKS